MIAQGHAWSGCLLMTIVQLLMLPLASHALSLTTSRDDGVFSQCEA